MIEGRKILGIVPARGGSKGVPRKNIREVAGKPLLAWTLEAAAACRYLDRTVVSTDDAEIARVALEHGGDVPFLRPAEISTDATAGIEPVLHALRELPGFDLVVLLQPTSPLRSGADIANAIEMLMTTGANSCVSVTEANDHPYWTYRMEEHGAIAPFIRLPPGTAQRRQDLPRAVTVNGAVYVAKTEWLTASRSFIGERTVGYEMPEGSSIDIDTEDDLLAAERTLRARGR